MHKVFRGQQEKRVLLVPPGAIGPQGIQGEMGHEGVQGLQGATGAQGIQGEVGPQGIPGPQGAIGPQGIQGEVGQQGIQGSTGNTGATGSNGATGADGIAGPQGLQGLIGPMGIQGVQGAIGPQGIQGTVGPTGPQSDSLVIETFNIAQISNLVAYNQSGGNNQAIGALIYGGYNNIVVNRMGSYIMRAGAGTGAFQMAILRPTSTSSSIVVGTTNLVNSITAGMFVLPLTALVTLLGNTVYYLAVFNLVNASYIGGISAGTGTVEQVPPINFRVQNLTGFSVGQTINMSDVSMKISPWIAVLQ